MILKKIGVVLCVLPVCIQAQDVVLPDWQAQVPGLVSSVQDMLALIQNDKALYESLDQQVKMLVTAMVQQEESRNQLTAIVRTKYTQLKNTLAQVVDGTVAVRQQAQEQKNLLQNELTGLAQSTLLEITRLTLQRNDLQAQLAQLTQTYNTSLGSSTQEAQTITDSLAMFIATYNAMIASRANFLAGLTAMQGLLTDGFARAHVTMNELAQEIV